MRKLKLVQFPRFLGKYKFHFFQFQVVKWWIQWEDHDQRNCVFFCHTVDGRNPANQLKLVVYPRYLQGFSYIPGGGSPDFWSIKP